MTASGGERTPGKVYALPARTTDGGVVKSMCVGLLHFFDELGGVCRCGSETWNRPEHEDRLQ